MIERFVLGDIHVNDVLDQTRIYPKPTITIRNFVDHWTMPEQHDYVVVDGGHLARVVSLRMCATFPAPNGGTPPFRKSCGRVRRKQIPTNWWRTCCNV